MRRTKLLVALLLTAAGMLSLGNSPVFAAPAPCPPSFIPFPFPPAPGDEAHDHNGNGLVCIKFVPGNGNGNSVVEGVVVKDDKADDDHDT